ncbi:MAG: helix-turn-helix domain-containing protein [Azonexus sp.]
MSGAASGERFRLARLRRELSAETLAERASTSRMTLHRAEKGTPAVAMGTYLRILAVLRLQNDIGLLAGGRQTGAQVAGSGTIDSAL